MIGYAVATINSRIKANDKSRKYFMVSAPIYAVVGIIVAVLAFRVNIWIGVVESVMAPGLVYSIKGIIAADRNNTSILNEASKVLNSVNNQIQLGWRLKK